MFWVRFGQKLLHTISKYLGVKIILRHVRNGIEMAPLLNDQYYDFNYQSPITVERPETIIAVLFHFTISLHFILFNSF
jgi:hypothetical protein